jgi:hypothetical protein
MFLMPRELAIAGLALAGLTLAGCGSNETDTAKTDPDLAAVVEAWPDLPEAIRAGIVAMVKGGSLTRESRGWKVARHELNGAMARITSERVAGQNCPSHLRRSATCRGRNTQRVPR